MRTAFTIVVRSIAFACLSAAAIPVSAVYLPISDEFDIPGTLANWNRIDVTEGWNANQLQTWDIDASQPGQMVMEPYAVTWYQDYRGPLVYKTLSGNFSLTTQVEVRNGANQSVTPTADYSLAGVMLRGPRNITNPATQWTAGGEDYVFLSLGFGNFGVSNGPQFEVKTTDNSNSVLQLTPAQGLTATLQLTRLTNNVGTFIIAALREPNSDWIIHRRYRRDDLAGPLQAGLVTYSDYNTASRVTPYVHNSNVLTEGSPLLAGHVPHPDLTAAFDYARYFDVGSLPAGLANADLLNTGAFPDSVLLQLLAPAPCPANRRLQPGSRRRRRRLRHLAPRNDHRRPPRRRRPQQHHQRRRLRNLARPLRPRRQWHLAILGHHPRTIHRLPVTLHRCSRSQSTQSPLLSRVDRPKEVTCRRKS